MRVARKVLWRFVCMAATLLAVGILPAQMPAAGGLTLVPSTIDAVNAQPADDPPPVYCDGAVTPWVEESEATFVPYSIREQANLAWGSIPADVQLAPLDPGQLHHDSGPGSGENPAMRIGVVRDLPESVSPANREGFPGHWSQSNDGGHYWLLTIESPGAKAIRLHLENLAIPPGGHVVVYNSRRPDEIYGPYHQADLYGYSDLWTTSVFGSVVTLEYYVPSGIDLKHSSEFEVTQLAHVYVDLESLIMPLLLPCHNDVTCHGTWSPEAHGVAGLGTINGSVALWCSGGLLNDFDDDTVVGYFLTANHCLSDSNSSLGTQAQANTIEYYWLYETPSCNGSAPNLANVPRTATGADLISRQTRDGGNDHAFMRIRGDLPGGLTLLGWDTAAFGNGDDVTGIHHPDGSFKRISFGDISGSNSNYWDVDWTSGTTEPGSSGSPVFDAAHRVRGQLWGDNRTCPGPGATARSVYGRYNVTYPLIRRWIEIGGTINVDSSYVGVEEGTPTKPFRTAAAAYNFAWNGSRLRFKAGNYPGAITFTKQLTLLARDGVVTIGQ